MAELMNSHVGEWIGERGNPVQVFADVRVDHPQESGGVHHVPSAHISMILNSLNEEGLQDLLLLQPVWCNRLVRFRIDRGVLHGKLKAEKPGIRFGSFEVCTGDLFQ